MAIADLQTELTLYQTARTAILEGSQSYTINGRSLTRADLSTIIDRIDALEARIARLSRSGGAVSAPLFPTLRG